MKSIVISGASTGIGFRLAEILAAQNYRVFAGARNEDDIKRLSAAHTNIVAIELDVTKPEQVDRLIDRLQYEQVVALINNAGIATIGPIETVTPEEFSQQLQVNLVGCYRMIRACAPLLRATKGRVINISSTSGLVAWPFAGAYVASKYGLEGLSDVLRLELGRFGIRTILINPGAVATPLWEKTFSAAQQRLDKQHDAIQSLYGDDMARSEVVVRKSIRTAVPPDTVVNVVVHALHTNSPKARYLVGPSARMQQWLKTLLPVSWFDWLKRKIVYGG
ncbi:MAG: SDR family oxidoreductase [Alcanivoracaceae bacterium]|nr:SDR family oxidoreductase [Alcanivoracaceae bacterium]